MTKLRISRNSFLAICLLCLAWSCQRPSGVSDFIKGQRVEYEFRIPQADTLALYDFRFFSGQEAMDSPVALGVRWVSPSAQIYREEVWLPMDGKPHYYRLGLRFVEQGDWTLRVYPKKKLSGLGISWEKNYGTR